VDIVGLMFVVLIVWAIFIFIRQIRFGVSAQRLARTLAAEGGLDREHLPRDEKGRVEREAAEIELVARQADAERSPEDWRAWFKLGVAFGDAGRGNEARGAVRRAVMLERKYGDGPGAGPATGPTGAHDDLPPTD
jgi:hypothetical protein